MKDMTEMTAEDIIERQCLKELLKLIYAFYGIETYEPKEEES